MGKRKERQSKKGKGKGPMGFKKPYHPYSQGTKSLFTNCQRGEKVLESEKKKEKARDGGKMMEDGPKCWGQKVNFCFDLLSGKKTELVRPT